jgi:hypothetical protein
VTEILFSPHGAVEEEDMVEEANEVSATSRGCPKPEALVKINSCITFDNPVLVALNETVASGELCGLGGFLSLNEKTMSWQPRKVEVLFKISTPELVQLEVLEIMPESGFDVSIKLV